MILRFRRGVRVFWSSADSLTVQGNGLNSFDFPSLDLEKALAALQQGIPVAAIEQQARMAGCRPKTLSHITELLADELIAGAPERKNANHQLRGAELTRHELNHGVLAATLSKRRQGWLILLSGGEGSVRSLAPLLSSAGLASKHSARGIRFDDTGPEHTGWQLSHRLGLISDRVSQLAVGFFQEQIDPEVYRSWMSRGTTHLAVVFHQNGAVVSRLVRPGYDSCLNCDSTLQPPSGVSKGTQYFQIRDRPLCFDDAQLIAGANLQILKRVLDWVDSGEQAKEHHFLGKLSETSGFPAGECGCLLDRLESNPV